MHRLAFLSSLATIVSAVAASSEINSNQARVEGSQATRTYMTVEFDYKLEANQTNTVWAADEYEAAVGGNMYTKKPLEDALLDIESNFVPTIQKRLPNGEIPEGKTLPDVKFSSVNSRFINMCFTESDACKWVKCRIKLSFAGDRPKAAMERATLDLAREYLEDVSDSNEFVQATFVYPMIYSSTVQLEFSPVEGIMSDAAINDLETSFYDVYHAIVNALDGDTDMSEAHFVYQIVEDDKLLVHVKYFGKCRFCTEDELVETINGNIESNQQSLLATLKEHQTDTYFSGIQDVVFSVPVPFDALPPIDSDMLDAEAPSVTKRIPWLLYLGAVTAGIVICTGIFVICKDQKELRKEEGSTSEESESYGENQHEGSITNDIEEDQSLNTNGMHEDYQVYVY